MKKNIKGVIEDLIFSDEEKYGVLKETCADILYGDVIDYRALTDLEEKQLDAYLRGENMYLSKEEDIYLGKVIYSANLLSKVGIDIPSCKSLNSACDRAINLLVKTNLRLVSNIAKKYIGLGVEYEDLLQDGTMKLMVAAKKYDYRRGFKFVTYATYWVQQGIREGIHNNSKTIRIPTHIISVLNKINSGRKQLEEELQREVTAEELSRKTGIPLEQIKKYEEYSQDVVYYQAANQDNDYTYENIISSNVSIEEKICDDTVKDALKASFKTLTKREIDVITLRYGLEDGVPRTLDSVGEILGVTRERVRQIEAKALRNLRHPSRSKYLKDYV